MPGDKGLKRRVTTGTMGRPSAAGLRGLQSITRVTGHYTYEFTDLRNVRVELDKSHQPVIKSIHGKVNYSFRVRIYPNAPAKSTAATDQQPTFTVRRNYHDFIELDKNIHYYAGEDLSQIRARTQLENLEARFESQDSAGYLEMRDVFHEYLRRLQSILQENELIKSNTILNWFCLDNLGRRTTVIHEDVNIPSLKTARCVREYIAQSQDELDMKCGDIITVLKLCPPNESGWWYGKNEIRVGFFPYDCIELLNEADRAGFEAALSPPKAVSLKHGKEITTLNELLRKRLSADELRRRKILVTDDRRKFDLDGLVRDRKVPVIVETCVRFIEQHALVTGVYRLPGSAKNVQTLRELFQDEERCPSYDDLARNQDVLRDVHCIPSLLKSFFRDLSRPLLTADVFEKCSKIALSKMADEDRGQAYILALQGLSSAHWMTLKVLMTHLYELADQDHLTNMSKANLAKIWAPNLVGEDKSTVAATNDMAEMMRMKASMEAESGVVTDLISMVPIVFGYQKPTPEFDARWSEIQLLDLREANEKFGSTQDLLNSVGADSDEVDSSVKQDPEAQPPVVFTYEPVIDYRASALLDNSSPEVSGDSDTSPEATNNHDPSPALDYQDPSPALDNQDPSPARDNHEYSPARDNHEYSTEAMKADPHHENPTPKARGDTHPVSPSPESPSTSLPEGYPTEYMPPLHYPSSPLQEQTVDFPVKGYRAASSYL